MMPNPQEGEQGGSRYFNSVFQELPEPDTGYNDRYLIPPNYIRGYVDVETQKFIPNPKFQPEKPTLTDDNITPRINNFRTYRKRKNNYLYIDPPRKPRRARNTCHENNCN